MKYADKIIVPLLILVGAFFLGKYLISLKEKPKSKQPEAVIPVVDVVMVSPDTHKPRVMSFGTVQSYFETIVVPQVSGSITEVAKKFRVGEVVKKGDLLVTLDATDFQTALATEQANFALQKRTLVEEEILAKQAAEDWLESGRKLDSASDFVLRKPQLTTAKANIASAEAAIKKAIADIERTRLTSPYDAVVTASTASVGNFATSQTQLGILVATERAEIRLPLTAEQVAQVKMPGLDKGGGATVHLSHPNHKNIEWSAKLVRREPTVDPQNQVTHVIVEIENPYTAMAEPLAIGSFVNASIPAKPIENVYKIPEAALVNDAHIWVLDEESKLLRLPAERAHSAEGFVYVRVSSESIAPPLRIVSRPLSNFRSATKVRINEDVHDQKKAE